MSKYLGYRKGAGGLTRAFSGGFNHTGNSEKKARRRRQEGEMILEKFC